MTLPRSSESGVKKCQDGGYDEAWQAVSPGDYEFEDAYSVLVDTDRQFLIVKTEADPDDADVPQPFTVYAVTETGLEGRGVYATEAEAKGSVDG